MGYFEHRSEIDVEIASCYGQIEELEKKIRRLKAQKAEDERMDRLVKQLNKKDSEN